jgi:uncharacterized membrane protein
MTTDLIAFAGSMALLAGYHLFLVIKLRTDPNYTFQAMMAESRAAWTRAVMEEHKDILAVQTLRNSTMAATFLASTAILLISGVLTLSTQGDKLAATWQVLDAGTIATPGLWLIKMLVLLTDLFIAFFSFTMSIRVFHHVGYMINVPISRGMSPPLVAAQLNRAGRFYWVGMRTYFLLVPMVLWLFGPILMVVSSIALVSALFRLDRLPMNTLSDAAPRSLLMECPAVPPGA